MNHDNPVLAVSCHLHSVIIMLYFVNSITTYQITLSLFQVCRNIDSQPEGTSTLERIYAGVNVYYNYTGTVGCFDLNDDPHGMGGWDWQVLKRQF